MNIRIMDSIIIKAIIFLITIKFSIICVFGVTGKQEARQENFNFMVSITRRIDNKHICGGNIIDRKWIITAARCVYNATSRRLYIRAGTDTLSRPLVTYNISAIVPHENFNETEFTNNIALVKIKGFFEFNKHVGPVRLGHVTVGHRDVIAGWGGLKGLSDRFHVISLRIMEPNECQTKTKQLFNGSPQEFCVSAHETRSPCDGDLGSPLIENKKLAGVYSYRVVTKCDVKVPHIFTKMSYYKKWISKTKKKCHCI